jgi:uncharacterized membrane protein YjjP (DUF1212 family)
MKLITKLTQWTHVLTHVLTHRIALKGALDALTHIYAHTCAYKKYITIQMYLFKSRASIFYTSIASIASIVNVYVPYIIDAFFLYASIASIIN